MIIMKTRINNILGGKGLTAVIASFVVLSLVFIVVQCIPYIEADFTNDKMNVILDGEYSLDDGEWKPIDSKQSINEYFHNIKIRGKVNELIPAFENLVFSTRDVWYTLRSSDGTFELSNRRTPPDIPEENYGPSDRMTSTPGYQVDQLATSSFPETVLSREQDMILEVEYPYSVATLSFSECFSANVTFFGGIFNHMFFKSLPSAMLFVLVCFFGLFFFPISSFILGKVNYRYLCFGMMCFFWGLYMIMQTLREFMNLWILDPTVCLLAVKLTGYLFITSIFLYLKSNMIKPITRSIANVTILVFFAAVAAAALLHLSNTADMTATSPHMFIILAVCTAVMITLLSIETHGNRKALIFLLSWSPLVVSLVLDIIDQYTHLAGSFFFNYGLAITMAYQIVQLIGDLRFQYKEAIRHQQMQKELYEAKVSVMTSQIRPHFMYNALTSIAMMCEIDPKIAKEATITFAKYLRGNMDSLKQTGPVPFTQELEHLKKYLYIEKLRFDDLLNIEYDIQATDFVLPLLSVQPLVENAVKHGVGMKEDGGTVRISTRETETAYEVVIEDDGVGFDVNEQKDDGRSHVGMENTKKRLHDMCGGEVKIESVVGKGTTAIVILPKEGQKNENTLS